MNLGKALPAPYAHGQLMLDQLGRQPKDGDAQSPKLGVPAGVRRTAASKGTTIDFHDELDFGGDEVANEEASNGNFATKLDAQPATANGGPQEHDHLPRLPARNAD